MKAFNIQWDTDGDMKLFKSLPKEIEIPQDVIEEAIDDNGIVDDDVVSDYISNEIGFCHFGFDLEY